MQGVSPAHPKAAFTGPQELTCCTILEFGQRWQQSAPTSEIPGGARTSVISLAQCRGESSCSVMVLQDAMSLMSDLEQHQGMFDDEKDHHPSMLAQPASMPHLSTTDSIERVTLWRFGNVVEPTRILQSAKAASGAILARAGLESSSVPSAGCAVAAACDMVFCAQLDSAV
jgi:hypothetical protein